MAKFLISGCIVDTDAERVAYDDVTPTQISSFIKGLGDGEELELDISSYGGSVAAGLAICNMLKMASAEGHKTTAHVIGWAASIASVIACACDELKIDSNAFLMIHNPYTVSMGDAEGLRKDADTLDKMRDALIAVYRTKFDLTDEAIKKAMDEETWIMGKDAGTFNLKAEIIPTEEPLKAAAFAGKAIPKFLHVPQTIADLIATKAEEKKAEEPKAKKLETLDYSSLTDAEVKEIREEANTMAKQREEMVAKSHEAEPTAEPKAEAEMVTKAEADKRVSGMQSKMQAQINDLRKEYDAKIEDFTNQLKVKDEELVKAKADATRLAADLESEKTAHAELSEKTSALEQALAAKTETLAKLNANVLTPNEELPTMKAGLAKCTTPAERVAFLQSGKYIK